MNDINKSFYGIKIIPDSFMQEFHNVPNKKHNNEKIINPEYHNMMQRRWNRIFGTHKQRLIISTNGMIITHPNNVKFIENNM